MKKFSEDDRMKNIEKAIEFLEKVTKEDIKWNVLKHANN